MSMDARMIRHAFATVVVWTLFLNLTSAASLRGTNFLVTAPDPQLAQEVLDSAEAFRRELAIEWLGHELPAWSQPCPITVRLGGGAGGQTSFAFHRGVPFNWTMEIFGPRDRVLDSVLPHEILHTIFATHYGRPLPRWADEGACTTVEHDSEKNKNTELLYRFLKSDRGIAFNRMFAMKEYPEDILPLYAQGYSLTRFLIAQGGKRKFVKFVGDGMRTENWTATTRKHYGHESLSSLQVSWLDWVRAGSNEEMIGHEGQTQLASAEQPAERPPVNHQSSAAVVRGQSPSPMAPPRGASANDVAMSETARSQQADLAARPSPLTGPLMPAGQSQDITPSQPGVSGGFYSRGGHLASNGGSNSGDTRGAALPDQHRMASRGDSTVSVQPRNGGEDRANPRRPNGSPTFYLPGGTSLYR